LPKLKKMLITFFKSAKIPALAAVHRISKAKTQPRAYITLAGQKTSDVSSKFRKILEAGTPSKN